MYVGCGRKEAHDSKFTEVFRLAKSIQTFLRDAIYHDTRVVLSYVTEGGGAWGTFSLKFVMLPGAPQCHCGHHVGTLCVPPTIVQMFTVPHYSQHPGGATDR